MRGAGKGLESHEKKEKGRTVGFLREQERWTLDMSLLEVFIYMVASGICNKSGRIVRVVSMDRADREVFIARWCKHVGRRGRAARSPSIAGDAEWVAYSM